MLCSDLLATLTYSPVPWTLAVPFRGVPASLPCFLAAAGQLTTDSGSGTRRFDGYQGTGDKHQHLNLSLIHIHVGG